MGFQRQLGEFMPSAKIAEPQDDGTVDSTPAATPALAGLRRLAQTGQATPEGVVALIARHPGERESLLAALHQLLGNSFVSQVLALLSQVPPAAEAATATDDEPLAHDDGTVSDDDGTVSTDDGTVAEDDGTVSDDDGTVSTDDGTVSEDDGTVSDDDGTVEADVGDKGGFPFPWFFPPAKQRPPGVEPTPGPTPQPKRPPGVEPTPSPWWRWLRPGVDPNPGPAPTLAEIELWNRAHVSNVVRFDRATHGKFAKPNGQLDALRVKEWQKQYPHLLEATGKVDDRTCEVAEGKLVAPLPPPPAPKPAHVGAPVVEIESPKDGASYALESNRRTNIGVTALVHAEPFKVVVVHCSLVGELSGGSLPVQLEADHKGELRVELSVNVDAEGRNSSDNAKKCTLLVSAGADKVRGPATARSISVILVHSVTIGGDAPAQAVTADAPPDDREAGG